MTFRQVLREANAMACLAVTMLLCTILASANAQDTGTNIALGKPTWQSSLYGGTGGGSHEANDGLTSISWPRCSHTASPSSSRPWLAVDLSDNANITSITLWNRDSLPGRLNNFEVRFGDKKPPNGGNLNRGHANALCVAVPGALPSGPTTLQCATPMVGRYLTVQLLGEAAILTICELQVFGTADPQIQPIDVGSFSEDNLALGKPSWQSSNHYPSMGLASEATDGNTSTTWPRCTHTSNTNKPWLVVDLQVAEARITSVTLWNRDVAPGRLSNFEIRIGKKEPPQSGPWNGAAADLCATHYGALPSGPSTIRCNQPMLGRYVTVQLMGTNYLTICELQATGTIVS